MLHKRNAVENFKNFDCINHEIQVVLNIVNFIFSKTHLQMQFLPKVECEIIRLFFTRTLIFFKSLTFVRGVRALTEKWLTVSQTN